MKELAALIVWLSLMLIAFPDTIGAAIGEFSAAYHRESTKLCTPERTDDA